MKRIYLFLSLFLQLCISASSQIHLKGYNEHLINPQLFEGRWPAQWIGVPEANLRDFGVYHFRKTFDLTSCPERFVVHVSADNRYKLSVNDSLVSLGPNIVLQLRFQKAKWLSYCRVIQMLKKSSTQTILGNVFRTKRIQDVRKDV